MFIKNILVTQAELNTGSLVTKELNNESYEYDSGYSKKYPVPSALMVSNASGDTVAFIPMTEREHGEYLEDSSISDFFKLSNNDSVTFNSFSSGVITHLLVSGVVSGHSGDVLFAFIKE